MADAKKDSNSVASMLGVSDIDGKTLLPLIIDPVTGRLKVSASFSSSYLQFKTFVTVGFSNADYICDGTADDVQIQEAIDYVNGLGGGIVFIKEGDYDITDNILYKNNVILQADGIATVLTLADNVNKPILKPSGTITYAVIKGFKIDGNKANNTSPGASGNMGITLGGASGIYVYENLVTNCYNVGIEEASTTSSYVFDNTITDCGQGIRLTAESNDNEVRNNIVDGNDYGIFVYHNGSTLYSRRNKIIGNTVINSIGTNDALAQAAGISLVGAPNTIVTDNIVKDNATRGIECYDGSTYSQITNNQVIGNGSTGIDTGPDDHLVISNNIVNENGGSGIYLSGVKSSIISDNEVLNNGQSTPSADSYSGIVLQEDSGTGTSPVNDNIITGNNVTDTQATKTQVYGIIECWTGTRNPDWYLRNIISNNNVRGNLTGDLSIISNTDTIENNVLDIQDISLNSPTELLISTISKGGIANGGFELGTKDTAVTSSGVIGVNSGWYLSVVATAMSAELDTAVSNNGNTSLKLEATDATGTGIVYSTSGVTLPILSSEGYPLKPSTTYRLTFDAKTNLVGASGVFADVIQYDSAAVVGTTVTTSKLSTTNDWTTLSLSFTSDSDASFGRIALHNDVAGAINQAWFDNVVLEEVVVDTTFTGETTEPIKGIIQAKTSVENIDQSYLIENGTVGFGQAIARYWSIKFTPTKVKNTKIAIIKAANTGTPTGNVTISIVNDSAGKPSTTTYYSKTYTPSEWNAFSNGYVIFDMPNDLVPGTPYHIKLDAGAADDSNCYNIGRDAGNVINNVCFYSLDGSTWTDGARSLNFKTYYAELCEGGTIEANGIKAEVKASCLDGFLSNAIIDLGNKTYSYYSNSAFPRAERLADVYSYSGTSLMNSTFNMYVMSATNVIMKVDTLLPIEKLNLEALVSGAAGSEVITMAISKDNSIYVDLVASTAGANDNLTATTHYVDGISTFYIRFTQSGGGGTYIDNIKIEANLNTSSIPLPLMYPLEVLQFSETKECYSAPTRQYFRVNKSKNGNGILMPSIEFTDDSQNVIASFFLPFNNSLETNPCVKLLSFSTGYTGSGGTGTVDGAGTILNADEYMPITGVATMYKTNYQVGNGTTTIGKITKNVIHLSSNSNILDSTLDASLQANFFLGINQQCLKESLGDTKREVEELKSKLLNFTTWTDWTPVLTWTTGTPEGSVITKARYKIIDKVCYFSFYYSATDGNDATALTISLPVTPKDNDSLTCISSQQLSDTTWSNPLAYIDDGSTTITFRSLTTIANTKAVKVIVSGFYEI